jgi:hypothetical protein
MADEADGIESTSEMERVPYLMKRATAAWRECRNSPAWVGCSAFALWLIAELHTGLLFSGVFGLAFGGLGVTLDRWLRIRKASQEQKQVE